MQLQKMIYLKIIQLMFQIIKNNIQFKYESKLITFTQGDKDDSENNVYYFL